MSAAGALISLPASLTLRDAQSALETLRQSLAMDAGADAWRIDASSVTQLDTSALAVLLECARIAQAAKRRLEIVGAPPRLVDLAHLYGVDGMLGLDGAASNPAAEAAPVVVAPLPH